MRSRLIAVTCLPAIALATAGLLSSRLSAVSTPVTLSEADETIPTYKSLPPDPNPMFFFGRQSQGAQGNIYPYRRFAMQAPVDYVFPFQDEVIPVLRSAMAANPQDARAPYYLGNLLFDWQPEEAVTLWEKSAALDPKFPVTWRNLAQAWSHQPGDEARAKAIGAMEKAVALSDAYPTHFAELDQLYADAGAPVEKRLALLESHQPAVVQKDEGLASLITLKTFAGRPDESISLLEGRTFSIWEGGTRFNTGEAWTDAHLARGLRRYAAKQYREALADFDAALKYPANLRAANALGGANPRQAELTYWTACTQEALGQHELARKGWTEVAGVTDAAPAGGRGGGRGGPGNQVTDKEKMLLTPTYHVFEMFKVHQGATSLPFQLTSPDYVMGAEKIPALSASASRDAAGKIHLSLANADPKNPITLSCKLVGASSKSVSGRTLTAPTFTAHNTFTAPNAVTPQPFDGAKVSSDGITVTLPAKSVVVLELL